MKDATVLITGATGFTGSVLLRKLCERAGRVQAIARPSSDISAFADLPVKWYRGDVFDPATIESAVQGVQYIFHVAACYRTAGLSDEVYHDVHVKSTQRLVEAALKQPDFKRFVHTSTVGVHGHIDEPPADETYRFKPGDIYQRTKAEAETWLHTYAAEHDLPYTVIRPAAIMGPDDRRLLKFFKMACWPLCPLLGSGRGLYHLIHVDDLTELMMRAATHPDAQGEAFICGNDRAVRIDELGRCAAEALGYPFRPLRLPAGPFFVAGDLCEAVCKPLGIEPPIYRRRVAFYTKDRSFRTSKIRDVLGYTCRYTNESAIRDTALGYAARGWLPRRNEPTA